MTPLETARANVAARLRRDAARLTAAADAIEAGEDDRAWAVKHEVARLEAANQEQKEVTA